MKQDLKKPLGFIVFYGKDLFFVLPVDPYPDAFGEKKLINRKDRSCVIG